jgi:hypothetical protein
MTTDVLGERALRTQEDRPFPAEMPKWVPRRIADFARKMLADELADPDCGPILIRLLTDLRMRTVWSQLARRNRKTGRFLWPAACLTPGETAEERQEFAMVILFSMICGVAPYHPSATLRRDLESARAQQQALARQLREEAEEQEAIEQWENDRPSRADKLHAAADALDEIAAEAGTREIAIVERDRGNLDAHGLAISIARKCCWLFGAPLFSVTATLTSVALDCKIPRERVSDWWEAANK